jgi:hypothetical protein
MPSASATGCRLPKIDSCRQKTTPAIAHFEIRVEIVLDPVHFCCSAVEARAKTLNLMANLLRNAGWHEPCSNQHFDILKPLGET